LCEFTEQPEFFFCKLHFLQLTLSGAVVQPSA